MSIQGRAQGPKKNQSRCKWWSWFSSTKIVWRLPWFGRLLGSSNGRGRSTAFGCTYVAFIGLRWCHGDDFPPWIVRLLAAVARSTRSNGPDGCPILSTLVTYNSKSTVLQRHNTITTLFCFLTFVQRLKGIDLPCYVLVYLESQCDSTNSTNSSLIDYVTSNLQDHWFNRVINSVIWFILTISIRYVTNYWCHQLVKQSRRDLAWTFRFQC